MPALFCSHCGKEIPSNAQFCSHCGARVGGAEASAPNSVASSVETAVRATRRLLLPTALLAVATLAALVAILLSKPRPQAPIVAAAPPPPPPAAAPLTAAPTVPLPAAPAVTSAPAPPAPTLPADAAAYVKFLGEIETRRAALENDLSGATTMMQTAHGMQGAAADDDPDGKNKATQSGVSKVNQGFTDYVAKWQALTKDFRAQTPPQSCSLLANAYLAYLTDYAATISKLQVSLLNGDLGGAMGAQGAQKQVDADAAAADSQLSDLCARYGVPKPFSIGSGNGGSSVVGM